MPYRPSLVGANILKPAPQLGYFTRSSICIAFSILSQNPILTVIDVIHCRRGRILGEDLLDAAAEWIVFEALRTTAGPRPPSLRLGYLLIGQFLASPAQVLRKIETRTLAGTARAAAPSNVMRGLNELRCNVCTPE